MGNPPELLQVSSMIDFLAFCVEDKVNTTNSETLDFLALREALLKVKESNLEHFIVETDCKAVAECKSTESVHWRAGSILEDIRLTSLLNEEITIN
ncbi:hypothetical protein L484_012830 [Morus notabilis]|uniref:Uncharacterized protein n=1 Tax=Morus notabilis TaxID=981085 RepID=W9R596_9ROSA|nr:hypothetical protein L484_012830 [Morus notabilis]